MNIQTPSDALDYKNDAISIWRRIKASEIFKQLRPQDRKLFIGGETDADWGDHLTLMTNAFPILWKKEFAQVAKAGATQLVQQKLVPPRWHLPPEGHWHMLAGANFMSVQIQGKSAFIDSILCVPTRRANNSKTYLTIRLFTSHDPELGHTPPSVVLVCDHPWPASAAEFEKIRNGIDETWGAEINQALFWLVAAEIFIEQSVFVAHKTEAERHAVKRALKGNIPSTVHVIRLRRTIGQEQDTSVDEARDIEWHCRWMVRGHWRQQFHPSDSSHKLLWIMPYIKGPEDKPFRAPLPPVGSVVR